MRAIGAPLPPLPAALVAGGHRDLLAPLRFLAPGVLESGVLASGALGLDAPVTVDRSTLAHALAAGNGACGHPAAEQLASKLADPATRVVVTGQQPGLFGGPLLTLAKAAAAVRWAETLEAAGMPAVAVFWVATQDHDFAETATASLLAENGLERVHLGDDPTPLMPVGMRPFGAPLRPVLERAQALYAGEHAAERWQRIASWYRPDARFGEAFSRFLIALFGARSPLMLDAMDSTVKRLEKPFLEQLVVHRVALAAAQQDANQRLEARDLPLQVAPQPGASPLFLLRGQQRRRILWHGADAWFLRGAHSEPESIAALLEIVRDNPAVISPGVLARPAIQDALLGTTLQVLGPSEMAYMAQATGAYRVLGIDAPWTTLRPQTLVLEPRQRAQLDELGIDLGALGERSVERLIADRLGGDVVAPVRAQIAASLAELAAPIAALDPTLEGPRTKTARQVDRALEQLGGKVAAAIARRHAVWHRRLSAIQSACFPGGKGQERTLSVAHFFVRHGAALAEAYLEQMALDPRVVQVVYI